MHTCIPSQGLKRSWHSCPRWMNASNKNTPSMHHPRRRNVTTSMVGFKRVTYAKFSPKMVNPRDIAGEHRRRLGFQGYSWGMRWRRRSRLSKCGCMWWCVSVQSAVSLAQQELWLWTLLSNISTKICHTRHGSVHCVIPVAIHFACILSLFFFFFFF